MAAAVPLILAGSAIYGAYEGHKAKKLANQQTNEMKAQADRQNAEYLAQQDRTRRQKAAISFGQRKSLLSGAQGGGNAGGTILTGPRGVSSVLGA